MIPRYLYISVEVFFYTVSIRNWRKKYHMLPPGESVRTQVTPPPLINNNIRAGCFGAGYFFLFSSQPNRHRSDHQIASDSQLPDNVAGIDDVSFGQSAGCFAMVGGVGGGVKGGAQQLFTSPVPLHSPTWYSCINSLFPLAFPPLGGTMCSLVSQAHPVKSAASSTARPQSCFSHARLGLRICITLGSL